jgi:hypothetical protein
MMAGAVKRTGKRLGLLWKFSRPKNMYALVDGKKTAMTGEEFKAGMRAIREEAKKSKGMVVINGERMPMKEFEQRVRSGELRGVTGGDHKLDIFEIPREGKAIVLSRKPEK